MLKVNGKKSYLVSALKVLFGILGLIFGWLEPQIAFLFISTGLGLAGLRHGIAKLKITNSAG